MERKKYLCTKLEAILKRLKAEKIFAKNIADSLDEYHPVDISRMRNAYKKEHPILEQEIEKCIRKIQEVYPMTIQEKEVEEGEFHFTVTLLQDEESAEADLFHFIYYYVDSSFVVDRCLLEINKKTKKAKLTTYQKSGSKDQEKSAIYMGDVIHEENQYQPSVSVYFHGRQNKPTAEIAYNFPSFCSFRGDIFQEKMSIGVFVSSFMVAGGLVVLQQIDKADAYENIHTVEIPDLALYWLFNARFQVQNEDIVNLLEKDVEKNVSFCEKWKGVYEAYTLHTETDALSLQKLIIEITKDGEMKFKSLGTLGDFGESKKGRLVKIQNDRSVVFQFAYSKRNRFYHIQMVFDPSMAKVRGYKQGEFLIGVFGGMESKGNKPMAGRIILFPADKKFRNLEVESYPLEGETEKFNTLIREGKHGKILRRFLRGELDTFVDQPKILELCPILQNNS